MSPFNLDMELKKGNREMPQQLPDLIRIRQDEIYASLDDIPLHNVMKTGKQKAIRSMLLVISAAVIMGICVIGSGFISPAMAASLKQIPLVSGIFKLAGDMGLKAAEEKGLVTKVNLSDTHDGVTVSVPQVMYDGNRVSIAIQREAQDITSYLIGSYVTPEDIVIFEPEGTKGTLKDTNITIDGKTYGSGFYMKGGADHNSVIIDFLTNKGPDYSPLPSQFQLTVEIMLEGINTPYIINVPAVKNTLTESTILTPNLTKSYEYVTIKLKNVELTPVMTRLAFVLDGTSRKIPEKYRYDGSSMLSLGYDVFDDQGNELKPLRSEGGYVYKDLLYEPLNRTSTFITIKPYTHVSKDKNTGEFLLDKDGWEVKEYVKELEMKIHIPEGRY